MPSYLQKVENIADAVKAFMFLSGLFCTVVYGGVYILWIWKADDIIAYWRVESGQAAFEEEVREAINELSGENRLIREPPGFSYVKEPVVEGEDIQVILNIARTERGKQCTFVGGTSVFRGQNGRPLPGSPLPAQRQINTNLEVFTVTLTPPDDLPPGRVIVTLQLSYNCPWSSIPVIENTRPLAYELQS